MNQETATTAEINEDFFSEVENLLMKQTENNNELKLEKGVNIVRLVSKPFVQYETWCVTTKEYQDKDGKTKLLEKPVPVYDGCGYEQDARATFYVYAIASNDQITEDGKPKIQILQMGKKILEGLYTQSEARKLQGEAPFKAIMDLDTIITKQGDGLKTTYSVNIMLSEKNNKITLTLEEIVDALKELPDLKEYFAEKLEKEKALHVKFGKPTSKASIERAEKSASELADLPVVDYDADLAVTDDLDF